ncbi:small conductance mechanosensitive channel [Friedmanniella endophytica]|uniref:Small conductance mechanosensitive channel n=1 Tax=Microlunatus kandeliicorticis TaxID=1759536 RepID=A0A7W3IVN1_9ACTN|nr:mechanosensitive ion channel domain-containing protein [Microlunatus kandeliicorticis]MBA8796101.1 small conductance mechanosensitive channel [Microlunatus kandeliicorticis]
MPDWLKQVPDTWLFVPIKIVVLLAAGGILRWVLHRVIDRAMRQALASQPRHRLRAAQALAAAASLGHERRSQRIRALGSLAKSLVTVVLLLIVVLEVLDLLSFPVTTIVASTTVIGLTVGFGAQNIVKDLISGVLLLVDDQLGVGDYVEMAESSGGASGIVEAVGFRVTQLRDDDGTVWYVRNGEVLRVGNYSQGGAGRPPVKRDLKPIAVRPPGRRLLRTR